MKASGFTQVGGAGAPRSLDINRTPARLLGLTLASVFVGELCVMLALGWLGDLPGPWEALIDGALLSLLVFPVLYFFLLKPLQRSYREQLETCELVARSDQTYRALIDSTEDSIYLVDAACRYLLVNTPHAVRLGLPGRSPGSLTYADVHSAAESSEFAAIIDSVVRGGVSERHEHLSARDGRYFLRSFSPVRDRDGQVRAVTVVSKEITELKLLEQKMQALSTRDDLTGLYNRRGFSGLADHRLKLAARQGGGVTLLYADLDNLKSVNDTRGHLAGDLMIRAAAGILSRACRETDIVARLGGDEFAVLLADAGAAAAEVIARVAELTARHNAGTAGQPTLSLSVGVGTCTPEETCSIDELIARADAAMYAAKSGRQAPPRESAAGGPGD